MTTPTKDHGELKRAAEAATPGPWHITCCADYWVQSGETGVAHCGDIDWLGDERVVSTQEQMEANARFIALANPATVLSILAENEALRAALELANDTMTAMVEVADQARDEWDAAPSGMKAGKLLIALSGELPGYRHDIDAIHANRAKLAALKDNTHA